MTSLFTKWMEPYVPVSKEEVDLTWLPIEWTAVEWEVLLKQLEDTSGDK